MTLSARVPVERQLAPPQGWHPAHGRIPPLRPEQLAWPLRLLLRAVAPWLRRRTGADVVPDVFLLLLRHPRLFWPWLRFASRMMPYGTLPRRDTELAILRVGWNCRCRYEWGQHVVVALQEGLAAQEIALVAQGPDAPGWTAAQSALLRACDEIHDERRIGTATWQALRAQFSETQMIEISLLIGHYEMLAGLLNSAGLPLDAHTEHLLAHAPVHG